MKVLICILPLIVSVSCTVSLFGAFGKSKGFGPYPPYPFFFPFPIGPPQPQVVKVIHEHVNVPAVSKVLKVVHQQHPLLAGAAPQIISDTAVPLTGPGPWDGLQLGPPGIPLEPVGEQAQFDTGVPVVEAGSQLIEGEGHDHIKIF